MSGVRYDIVLPADVKEAAPPRLLATFRPQAWIDDEAVDVDGRVEFDATEAFLRLTNAAIRAFEENDLDSDGLHYDCAVAADFDGPFEVDVDVDGWLAALGCGHGRADLSDTEIAGLRARYGVKTGG